MLDFNYKNYILLISRLTILFAGLVANFELDLKKVVAYSTLRQLGFIIRILSIGSTELVFFSLEFSKNGAIYDTTTCLRYLYFKNNILKILFYI